MNLRLGDIVDNVVGGEVLVRDCKVVDFVVRPLNYPDGVVLYKKGIGKWEVFEENCVRKQLFITLYNLQ